MVLVCGLYGAQNEAYNVERGRKTPKAVYLQRVFALRLGQIRLRPWDDRFTHRGLHVYACGLFCLCVGKSFVCGRLARLWALYCVHV